MFQRECLLFSASDMSRLRYILDAWHVITTTDALIDSDEEIGDYHARLDYGKWCCELMIYCSLNLRSVRRLDTLKRLRGKSPTPEPVPAPVGMDVDKNVW